MRARARGHTRDKKTVDVKLRNETLFMTYRISEWVSAILTSDVKRYAGVTFSRHGEEAGRRRREMEPTVINFTRIARHHIHSLIVLVLFSLLLADSRHIFFTRHTVIKQNSYNSFKIIYV